MSTLINTDSSSHILKPPAFNWSIPKNLNGSPSLRIVLQQSGYEDQHFDGAVTWFTNWGIWTLFDEGIGYRIIDRINAGAGQPKSFEAAPGHRFRADELADAIGMLMQPMIFGWDCFYVPTWSYGTGEFFLYISHDSYVTVVTRTKGFHDLVFQKLEELHLSPKSASEAQIKRFCRRA